MRNYTNYNSRNNFISYPNCRTVLLYLPKRNRWYASALNNNDKNIQFTWINIRQFRIPLNTIQHFLELSSADIEKHTQWHIERRYRKSSKLFSLIVPRTIYKKFCHIKARWQYCKTIQAMLSSQCTDIVFNNGNRLPEAIIELACKRFNIQPWFRELGMLPGTIQLAPTGVNALNDAARKPNELPSACYSKSRRPQFINSGDYILIPFQVDYDTQIVRHSNWVKSMDNLAKITLALAKKFPDESFVIREHPLAKKSVKKLFDYPKNITFDELPLPQSLANAKAIITVNSTVGMEALTIGKKLIVLGEACYAWPEFTLQANNFSELKAAILQLPAFQPETKTFNYYCDYLLHNYLIPHEKSNAFTQRFIARLTK